MGPNRSITKKISQFAVESHYEDLPQWVVDETKRLILDSIGCAIGGVNTEKGRIGIQFGEQQSGRGETTIMGHSKKAYPASS
ncbi:MAG: MmgE/PrpD family protein, partial [Thermodesulfobacteriota bacterium]|nr:MmgE/PrpD family protein [Thermodesulfobacteriota bacterium]